MYGLFILFLVTSTSATYIQIIPTLSAPDIIQEQTSEFPLAIVNNGDESAFNVQLSLVLPDGFTSSNIFYRELKPKEQRTDKFTVKINDTSILPGTYVVSILIHYTDANQYPFSSVTSIIINYKTPTISAVYGVMDSVSIQRKPVEMMLLLRNRGDKPHNLKIKLILPDELIATNTNIDETLNANEEKSIPIMLSSQGALVGAVYPITARISYEDNNQHFSAIARGIVRIEESTYGRSSLTFLAVGAVILIIVGFFYFKFVK